MLISLYQSFTKRQLVILLLLIGLCIYSYFFMTWTSQEIDRGYDADAQKNPYLAANFYLQSLGVKSSYSNNLQLLYGLAEDDRDTFSVSPSSSVTQTQHRIGPHDVVVFIHARGSLDKPRSQWLNRWVENGGTLVYGLDNPFYQAVDVADPLIDDFAIHYIKPKKYNFLGLDKNNTRESDDNSDAPNDEQTGEQEQPPAYVERLVDELTARQGLEPVNGDSSVASDSGDSLLRNACETDYLRDAAPLQADVNGKTLQLKIPSNQSFTSDFLSDTTFSIADEDQLKFAAFSRGAGQIIFSSGSELWMNPHIGCGDNAYFLSLLLPDGAKESTRVWFLVNQHTPSLVALFWYYAPYALCFFVAAIVAWLWRSLMRFGPIYEPEKIARRSFSEHIYAAARLLWRTKNTALLITRMRVDIQHRIYFKNRLYESFDQAEKIDWLLNRTPLQRMDIYLALFKNPCDIDHEFVELVRNIKIIKDNL